MSNPIHLTAAIVAVATLAALSAQDRQPADRPSTSQVLARFVQALGGDAAIRRPKSMTVHLRRFGDDTGADTPAAKTLELFDDFLSFGAALVPARTTFKREGQILHVEVVTSVTYDDVPDSVFAAPRGA